MREHQHLFAPPHARGAEQIREGAVGGGRARSRRRTATDAARRDTRSSARRGCGSPSRRTTDAETARRTHGVAGPRAWHAVARPPLCGARCGRRRDRAVASSAPSSARVNTPIPSGRSARSALGRRRRPSSSGAGPVLRRRAACASSKRASSGADSPRPLREMRERLPLREGELVRIAARRRSRGICRTRRGGGRKASAGAAEARSRTSRASSRRRFLLRQFGGATDATDIKDDADETDNDALRASLAALDRARPRTRAARSLAVVGERVYSGGLRPTDSRVARRSPARASSPRARPRARAPSSRSARARATTSCSRAARRRPPRSWRCRAGGRLTIPALGAAHARSSRARALDAHTGWVRAVCAVRAPRGAARARRAAQHRLLGRAALGRAARPARGRGRSEKLSRALDSGATPASADGAARADEPWRRHDILCLAPPPRARGDGWLFAGLTDGSLRGWPRAASPLRRAGARRRGRPRRARADRARAHRARRAHGGQRVAAALALAGGGLATAGHDGAVRRWPRRGRRGAVGRARRLSGARRAPRRRGAASAAVRVPRGRRARARRPERRTDRAARPRSYCRGAPPMPQAAPAGGGAGLGPCELRRARPDGDDAAVGRGAPRGLALGLRIGPGVDRPGRYALVPLKNENETPRPLSFAGRAPRRGPRLPRRARRVCPAPPRALPNVHDFRAFARCATLMLSPSSSVDTVILPEA